MHPEKSSSTFLNTYQASSISQLPNGTYMYCAKFPWKEDKPYLPSNFNLRQCRTMALLTKLKLNPALLNLYNNIIQEQERRGFVERVDNTSATPVHYLSHHPVKKDSPTTPIRIVYNCSCRENPHATSLNDCLMVGPPFLNDLCTILLCFRLHNYTLSINKEKVFLHVPQASTASRQKLYSFFVATPTRKPRQHSSSFPFHLCPLRYCQLTTRAVLNH